MRVKIKLLFLLFLTTIISCTVLKNQKSTHEGDLIKVMTYNVHHCNPPGTENIDVDAIANAIKGQNADLVAIQEVDVNTHRSGGIDEPHLLALKAGYPYYYFGKAMDFDGGKYGIMILSKYLLTDTQTYALPSANISKDEPRILAAATVNLPDGKVLRFGSTHLEAFNKSSRILQAKEISRIAGTTTLPFIVAGDFNDHEDSETIGILKTVFAKTCEKCPPTFNEEGDSGAIDFIMFSPKDEFKIVSHSVKQEILTSDHFPVVSELKWR